ncbi:hypothetical protein AJ79_07699 [Helicocarpus griseus UAMH5409]|uniref:L-ornithine N(5)-monooxygenase n=1 Tax=Helicocarpus griseus UAMH5409 TaxID=1447875 RepID=A0A2B7X090_9EURO|nr:hypothetical protein AJ79_07699 [Helicocarpus griseus UAMH5409]
MAPEALECPVVDVIIIGAGPCGLAAAARLREETPSALFTDEEHQRYHWLKRHSGRMALVRAHNRTLNSAGKHGRRVSQKGQKGEVHWCKTGTKSCTGTRSPSQPSILVLDSSGDRWLEKWNRSFEKLQIPCLRSPMFFHVDPGDRDGMLAFSRETGREDELWEIPGCVGQELSKHKKKKRQSMPSSKVEIAIDERDRKDYFSPSTKLFADHCTFTASRYGLDKSGQILVQEARDITYDYVPDYSNTEKLFTVKTDKGCFHAKAVVLAIGPGNTKNMPWQMSKTEITGACHSLDIKTFPDPGLKAKIKSRRETNVVVVGGGLSSAHIIDMAVKAGVSKVWHFTRGELKVKHFDIGLTWMGKFKNYEKAVFWSAESDEERLDMIKTARNGGSITPRMHKVLKQHVAHKKLSICTHTTIASKYYDPVSGTWQLDTTPPMPDLPRIDYIYFATGVSSNVAELPLLGSMNRDHPIEIKQGLPCITEDLTWKHDIPLLVTGRLAALQLGPGAANLEGARLGAERIAWTLERALGRAKDEDRELSRVSFCGHGNRYDCLSNQPQHSVMVSA